MDIKNCEEMMKSFIFKKFDDYWTLSTISNWSEQLSGTWKS
jgi:hypothetical protein